MNLLNKLTLKNLKLNKKRTLVTIIGIILSVALITAVSSMYSSAIKSLIKFEKYQMGDFHVKFKDVNESDLEKFQNNRKIDEIYLTQNIGYAKIESKNEYKPYAYIKAFTKKSLEKLSVKLVDGRLPENEEEILIPTHLKTSGRVSLNIGDTITLDVGKRLGFEDFLLNQDNPYLDEEEKIVDTKSITYKIVGIVERPATNIESYSAPGFTFITYLNENDLNGPVDLYAKYTSEGVKDSYKVTANILGIDEELFKKINSDAENVTKDDWTKYESEITNAKYEIEVNSYLITLETNPIHNSGVGGLDTVVLIVCLIIVITSVFCIKNSFDISITEKIKQYGMLRSIGATKKQIKKNVFYEALILGIIGIPLGIILGYLASFILIVVSNFMLKGIFVEGLKLVFSFSWFPVLVAIALGIVTIYFSAFKSARKASLVSPIESIRNSANIKIKSKKIKSPKIIKKIFGIGGEISFKNLKRNKRKYRTTVFSIIISVAVFIALSSFMNMAFTSVKNELRMSEYNLFVYLNDKDSGNLSKQALELVKLDNVLDYSVVRNVSLYFENPKYNKEYLDRADIDEDDSSGYLEIISLGDYQYQKYIKSLGLDYENIKDKGILVDYSSVGKYDENKNSYNYKSMRIYDYQNNDKILGNVYDNNEFTLEIGFISSVKPFGYINENTEILVVSDEFFEQNFKTNHVNIYYKSDDASKLQDNIETILENADYSVNNIEENVKMMNKLFILIAIFLYGFIIVISLIGITNIFNTITTNMELRRQEFAMLKSVGMTNKEFKRMIRLESLFMGIKSLIFGISLGLIISYLIYYYLVYETGESYSLPIVAIVISIVAVFLLITSLMSYSMKKINKQNTIETIRNENI